MDSSEQDKPLKPMSLKQAENYIKTELTKEKIEKKIKNSDIPISSLRPREKVAYLLKCADTLPDRQPFKNMKLVFKCLLLGASHMRIAIMLGTREHVVQEIEEICLEEIKNRLGSSSKETLGDYQGKIEGDIIKALRKVPYNLN